MIVQVSDIHVKRYRDDDDDRNDVDDSHIIGAILNRKCYRSEGQDKEECH